MKKLIIEARINEYQARTENPHVPWLAEEIARDAEACQAEGASIVHFHSRHADGSPDHDFSTYQETIRRIRAVSDLMINPTLGYVTLDASAEERLSNVVALAKDPATRPEFAPMDMGSVNVDWYDPSEPGYRTKGLIYKNGTDTLEYFATNISASHMKHYLVGWNVSFIRQTIAFMDMGLIEGPVPFLIVLTDGIMLAGHPGTEAGLDAHLAFIPEDKKIEWIVCNFNGNLFELTEKAIREGGHIGIGLGDYPYAELGQPTNSDLVRRVREQAESIGRQIASPDEARQMLGVG